MYISGDKVEKVEIEGDKLRIVIVADIEEVIDKGGFNYELKNEITKVITTELAKWVVEKYGKEIKEQAYTNGLIHQFWFEDGKLHLWVNTRSGLYTISLNEEEELTFLADMDKKHLLPIDKGTVYEFKEILKRKV